MLRKIWIKNFALIKELNLDFSNGFTVITGETGSGKSIFLGALNLMLGERADFGLIGPHAKKTVVEAEFDMRSLNLKSWFEETEIDFEESTIIRREINDQGRSRAFVNDTPVSLHQMKALVENLIFIHSQHHTLSLKDKNFHLELIDTLSGTIPSLSIYTQGYVELGQLRKQHELLREELERAKADQNYITFQLEELSELRLESVNFAEMEHELNQQENIDQILSSYQSISDAINDEQGIGAQLRILSSVVEKSANSDSDIETLSKRLKSVLFELEDIANDSDRNLTRLEKDPEKIAQLTSMLDGYNRVLSKHRCADQAELMAKKEEWQVRIDQSVNGEEELNGLQKKIEQKESGLWKKAESIHALRLKSGPSIEKSLHELLSELKMPDTYLKFELTKLDQLRSNGISEVKVLFCPNKGLGYQPIEKAASGGELSRVMLSLQCLISEKKQLPSILFDEIDTGVSGEVAQKIGRLLKRMGGNMQLLAISHLPQVAGKAQHHLKVEKFLENDVVRTSMSYLSDEQRVEEIARLMSGEEINSAALQNAKALMNEI
jgi:DNA repair protein RecN (Recombination protein N)